MSSRLPDTSIIEYRDTIFKCNLEIFSKYFFGDLLDVFPGPIHRGHELWPFRDVFASGRHGDSLTPSARHKARSSPRVL